MNIFDEATDFKVTRGEYIRFKPDLSQLNAGFMSDPSQFNAGFMSDPSQFNAGFMQIQVRLSVLQCPTGDLSFL